MKKLLLFLMAVISLGLTARGADGDQFTVDNLKYTVLSESDRTVQIQGYESTVTGRLVIPSNVSFEGMDYSVTQIGYMAFDGCNMTAVSIPSSISYIENAAFNVCNSLNEISVDVENEYYTSINRCLYNKDASVIECFPAGSNIAQFTIPDHVSIIGENAFIGCSNLTNIVIPESVVEIGFGAFANCSHLTKIEIPNSVKKIGGSAFWGDYNLVTVNIPDTVTELGGSLFYYCYGLKSVRLPEGLEIIDMLFYGCSSLASIVIPESVTSIEMYSFLNCYNLKSIYVAPFNPPTLKFSAFSGVPDDAVVYIPKGTLSRYIASEGWSSFTNFKEIPTCHISFNQDLITLEVGQSMNMSDCLSEYSDEGYDWESASIYSYSSNPEVVTVSEYSHTITAHSQGTATITYTEFDRYGIGRSAKCQVEVTAESGVDGISAEEGSAAEYYNLNGIRVSEDGLAPGLYIKRQGGKTEKLIVK